MNEIEINVEPRYMAGQSDVYRDRYAFNYLITICNRSDEIITLRQRFWEITDGHGETEQVGHAGLIEEQPVLYPGEAYEYNSGSQISTPWAASKARMSLKTVSANVSLSGCRSLNLKQALLCNRSSEK